MRKFSLCPETPYIIVIGVGKQWYGDTFRSNGLVRNVRGFRSIISLAKHTDNEQIALFWCFLRGRFSSFRVSSVSSVDLWRTTGNCYYTFQSVHIFDRKWQTRESMSIFWPGELVIMRRRYEIPSISVITSKDSFTAVLEKREEEEEEKKRTSTGFHRFFFHSFLHFQSSSHPFTLIPVAFRNARSVKLLAESR